MAIALTSEGRRTTTRTNNNISSSNYGIYPWYSSNNTITNNTISNNNYNIFVDSSNNNTIYLNNFINNSEYFYSHNSTNIWNSPLEITYTYDGSANINYLGNYWDDYTDVDADNDGIWDNPYSINSDKDRYPLMESFENYITQTPTQTLKKGDIVITSPLEITAKDIYFVGDTLTAKFTVTNSGAKSATFDVFVVGGRDPTGEVVDFDKTYDVTLNPGDSYDYIGYLTLPNKQGTYHFFCAYQAPAGNWNTNIAVELDGKIVEDFSEAKKYRERDITVFEKTYISQAPPPVIWEEIPGPWEDKHSGISQIAVHPNNPEVVYAAVKCYHYHWGYEGDELYKSTDGGYSWNPINQGLPCLTLSDY
jgi:parallel beta-helix repeat protein